MIVECDSYVAGGGIIDIICLYCKQYRLLLVTASVLCNEMGVLALIMFFSAANNGRDG